MASPDFRFRDRLDAGRKLAAQLLAVSIDQPVVYALPRGGVPVALEIARALNAPLDLILVRKIGAPGAPELALGALVEGNPPEIVINEDVRRTSRADDVFLSQARERELQELERRRSLYLGDRPRIDPAGHTAIIVDDGLATGATAKAALIALQRRGATRTILAVPVAPKSTLDEMATHADLVICLRPAVHFSGVGTFYGDFHQLSDEETIGLLRQAWSEHRPALPAAQRGEVVPGGRAGAR